ncbi:MAG: bifunctional nuclease family protein [Dysgonamonadaceae bacterium]|nr:bifunctional nuclease family protein [Dysgonamonadaceae bacterium]MDD4729434.1 bifunctional nuclease family protein [Dysgonamonadaceae bacterium]
MMQRVKLSILGISFSQVQAGAYALIFSESDGPRRLPIVIGTPEAQSIAIVMEKITPPRPLSHDLIVSVFSSLEIELLDVFIYKFDQGAFFAELTLKQGDNEFKIDSRTSDGVALAVRTNAPIFTTEEIMRDMAIVFDEKSEDQTEMKDFLSNEDKDLSQLNTDTLNTMLQEALSKEDFEAAIQIRDELNMRKD